MHDGGLQLRTHIELTIYVHSFDSGFVVWTSKFNREYIFWQIELLKYFEMVNYMQTFGSHITRSDKPNYS
jgi:hypothetical protein